MRCGETGVGTVSGRGGAAWDCIALPLDCLEQAASVLENNGSVRNVLVGAAEACGCHNLLGSGVARYHSLASLPFSLFITP